jgi:hypothetical protein
MKAIFLAALAVLAFAQVVVASAPYLNTTSAIAIATMEDYVITDTTTLVQNVTMTSSVAATDEAVVSAETTRAPGTELPPRIPNHRT